MSDWEAEDRAARRARAAETSPWAWRSGETRQRSTAAQGPTSPARWRSRPAAVEPEPEESAAAPPRRTRPVPRMPRARSDTQVRSPFITLAGTLLIIGLTVLAFAGGRLFGRVEEPTTVAEVEAPPTLPPRSASMAAPVEPPENVTPVPLPAAWARPPVVCIDPGHGGPDRGFPRYFSNDVPAMEEATLVLEQAWDLEARLLARGYAVVMTRETDAAVNIDGSDVNGDGRTAAHDPPRSDRNLMLDEIQARINICNEANADLLVSMHINGFSTGKPRGFETWFTREREFGDRNAIFATLAFAHLKEQLGSIGYSLPAEEERGVYPDSIADVQKEHSLFNHYIITGPAVPGVVQPSKMPGAIVEALFISNDGDAVVLADPGGRSAIVTAYENAIVEYFERYPPESR